MGTDMFRMTNRESAFFDMFVKTAENTCKAAEMLNELMTNFVDIIGKLVLLKKQNMNAISLCMELWHS